VTECSVAVQGCVSVASACKGSVSGMKRQRFLKRRKRRNLILERCSCDDAAKVAAKMIDGRKDWSKPYVSI
jgi:hypothetical protein